MDWSEQEVALEEKRELKIFEGNKSLSDKELLTLIAKCIEQSPYLDVQTLNITAQRGKVTLAGTVSSEANKMRLRELIESMPNVVEIRNHVKVAV